MILRRAAVLACLAAACLSLGAHGALAQSASPQVVELRIDGVVDPFVADHVEGGIADAADAGAAAVLLTIDTPGGLDSSMRQITQAILNAKVPVIGYVSPSGARAASAGTFILLSTNVAAMAPATNVGAAQPVGLSGAVASEKAVNDAAEYIVSIAETRDRNAVWAESAVRDAESASAEEALQLGVIDLIAPDVPTLLADVNGMTVQVSGEPVTLDVAGATVTEDTMGFFANFFHSLLDPNLAFVFFWLGLAFIVAEFFIPGGIVGTLGVLMFVASLVALGMLPVQIIGVVLLVASVVFFVLELLHPGVGLPAIAGVVCLVLGGLYLFDTSVPGVSVSPIVDRPGRGLRRPVLPDRGPRRDAAAPSGLDHAGPGARRARGRRAQRPQPQGGRPGRLGELDGGVGPRHPPQGRPRPGRRDGRIEAQGRTHGGAGHGVDRRATRREPTVIPLAIGVGVVLLLLILIVPLAVKIVREYQRLMVFRLGRAIGAKGPGLVLLIPFVDKGVWVDLRELYLEIPHQAAITEDNATISIDFIVFYRVVDARMSVIEVGNFAGAAQNIAATTLRSVVGDMSLDDVLAKREEMNEILRNKLDEVTERWGVKVTNVEIREIIPPPQVQDAMTRQMSAERTRRAVVTEAEGAKQAAITVAEGNKQSAILNAEGDRQAAILRAEGFSLALTRIFESARGVDAKTMSLQYLETLKQIGQSPSTKFVIPMEFTNLLSGITDYAEQTFGNGKAGA